MADQSRPEAAKPAPSPEERRIHELQGRVVSVSSRISELRTRESAMERQLAELKAGKRRFVYGGVVEELTEKEAGRVKAGLTADLQKISVDIKATVESFETLKAGLSETDRTVLAADITVADSAVLADKKSQEAKAVLSKAKK